MLEFCAVSFLTCTFVQIVVSLGQRFGCALVTGGQLNLKQKSYAKDFEPIDKECDCSTCKRYTRAYLHTIVTVETVACHLLTVHNIAYQVKWHYVFCK